VDDQRVVRDGLTALLDVLDGLEVVGAASDGAQALDVAERQRPHVVLMDLRMPIMDGVEATRQLRAHMPDVAIVVLTTHADDESVFAALRAGARGYLLKGASRDEITRAMEAVANGEVIIGAAIAGAVMTRLAAGTTRLTPFPQLTDREHEVLDLVARGLSNGDIARRLYLSEKTVRNVVSAVLTKLPADTRPHAIAMARDAGLGATELT